MGADRWDEQVGSVADEASRLLESLRRSAADLSEPGGSSAGAGGRHRPATGAPPPAAEQDDAGPQEPGAPPGCVDPFCAYCPLCRSAAVIRSLSPETLARLADLATVAATVLADLASTRSAADEDRPADRAQRPEPTAAQPIPVRDVDDPEEGPRG